MFSKATVPHNYLESAVQQGIRVLETEPPRPFVSVPQLVLQQSVLHSHAVAVQSGTEILTYAELDRRASISILVHRWLAWKARLPLALF